MNSKNEQADFWENQYAREYMAKNKNFNHKLGIEAWRGILKHAKGISSVLECGSNVGRNIGYLNDILPGAKKSIIELYKSAFDSVTGNYLIDRAFNGLIVDSNFEKNSFDLVFTSGVLIHIHPDNLIINMRKMYEYSSKYILIAEYFNRTPVMLEYQGQQNKLFKSDFGKLFIENFKVKIIDYGFLWGYVYDDAGFDDITWWLFEKQNE